MIAHTMKKLAFLAFMSRLVKNATTRRTLPPGQARLDNNASGSPNTQYTIRNAPSTSTITNTAAPMPLPSASTSTPPTSTYVPTPTTPAPTSSPNTPAPTPATMASDVPIIPVFNVRPREQLSHVPPVKLRLPNIPAKTRSVYPQDAAKRQSDAKSNLEFEQYLDMITAFRLAEWFNSLSGVNTFSERS